jgi:hypothetical protein
MDLAPHIRPCLVFGQAVLVEIHPYDGPRILDNTRFYSVFGGDKLGSFCTPYVRRVPDPRTFLGPIANLCGICRSHTAAT